MLLKNYEIDKTKKFKNTFIKKLFNIINKTQSFHLEILDLFHCINYIFF